MRNSIQSIIARELRATSGKKHERKIMKTPPYDDALQCLKYRKESKSGGSYNPIGQAFCEKIYKKYPEWYASTEEQIFKETKPYGSKD